MFKLISWLIQRKGRCLIENYRKRCKTNRRINSKSAKPTTEKKLLLIRFGGRKSVDESKSDAEWKLHNQRWNNENNINSNKNFTFHDVEAAVVSSQKTQTFNFRFPFAVNTRHAPIIFSVFVSFNCVSLITYFFDFDRKTLMTIVLIHSQAHRCL